MNTNAEEQDQSPDGDEPVDNFNSMTNEQLMEIFRTFVPVELMLETLFVPFLQDYQPSIGDVDPFIKIQRPDGKQEPLGQVVLDEPCVNQSDPTILISILRAQSTSIGTDDDLGTNVDDRVRSIEADKKQIDDWIKQVDKVHLMQGPTEINYTIRPPADTIMEVWDQEMEGAVRQYELPKANIDLSLQEYAKFCCLMLDIPIAENIIESIHMFFQNYRDVLDANEIMKNYK